MPGKWIFTAPLTKEDLGTFRKLRKTRFLVDENMDILLFLVMRRKGINVKTYEDLGLSHKSDHTVYSTAWRERRCLVSHDEGFMNDRMFPINISPGVIILPAKHGLNTHYGVKRFRMLEGFFKMGNLLHKSKIRILNEREYIVRGYSTHGRVITTRYIFEASGDLAEWVEEES